MNGLLPTTREVINMSGGVKQIAPLIGLSSPNLLLNQTCQTNHQHKLGAEDLQRIIRQCRPHSMKILQILASEIDGVVIALPRAEPSDHDFHQLVFKAAKEFGDVGEALMKSIDPKSEGGVRISLNELNRIEKEVLDVNRVFQEILARARRMSDLHSNRPKPDK